MNGIYNSADDGDIVGVSDMLNKLNDFQTECSGHDVYLRGQANACWGLEPSISRKDAYEHGGYRIPGFSIDQEKALLHRFRRYAHAVLGSTPNPWEGVFLAKHHDLPVRLLDWTSNPLVALFNAVESNEHLEQDGAVWIMARTDSSQPDIDVLTEPRSPLDIPGIRMIYPTQVSPRLVVQSGSFTLHDHPWTELTKPEIDSYATVDLDIYRLKKLVVRHEKKLKINLIDELERMGINNRTLFPDLDHLAKGLWQLEAIRR